MVAESSVVPEKKLVVSASSVVEFEEQAEGLLSTVEPAQTETNFVEFAELAAIYKKKKTLT